MTGRTSYGDLTHDAARQIAAGAATLTAGPFPDRTQAIAAITAHSDLCDSLYHLGWTLLGGDIRAVGLAHSANPDPTEHATVRLVDELRRIGIPARFGDVRPTTGIAGHWTLAARSLRTATDLLATYHDRGGRPRTPTAAVLQDANARHGAYLELAGLARAVAGTSDQLVMRSRAAGASPKRTSSLSPRGWAILEAAATLRIPDDALAGVGGPDPLRAMEVARPSIRGQDPILELEDRLVRLHRVAWQLTTHEHASVATLADLAAVGVLVNEAAHRSLLATARANGTGLAELGLHTEAEAITRRGNAWRAAHQQLRTLHSPSPAMVGTRMDVLKVQHLLQAITSADVPTGRATALLLEVSRTGEATAAWNSLTLLRLHTAGKVLAPGSRLPGDSIQDDPALILAKINKKLARAPEASIQIVRCRYADVQTAGHIDAENDDTPSLTAVGTAL